ncbi:MAG TPA: GNAT family N-acetyltransferase [Actinomycetota bacterium]|nr:GNAT family N-acetyltransferase [Actinomycetota bacterium]
MEPEIRPVTPDRWDDLVALFGDRGVSGCWCMWWRLSSAEFERRHGAGTRRALKGLVDRGRVPGLLAYLEGRPVGWVSVAPREEFGRVERSRHLRPVDDQPVWSIVCFYIDRGSRGRGVGSALLRGAVRYAAEKGAEVVEAYPVDPKGKKIPSAELYTGTVEMFRAAGFEVAADRGGRRRIMRTSVR